MKRRTLARRGHALMDSARLRLSRPDALLALAVLGLATGVLAGLVIVGFRLAVEGTQASFLPGGLPESYEQLPPWMRFALPVAGGLLIGVVFQLFARGDHILGVARVMERLAYHQGYLTLRGFILQFVGAAVAIVSGHSVGREGPHVFLGAAAASLLGQRLMLPNNSIRTLVGCGTAAGIAASFNTPLAGVIFALEVVMMDYTLASFIPVILAAVSADTLSILVFGAEPAFRVPSLQLGTLAELPVVLLLGVAVGALAAAFVHLLKLTTAHSQRIPYLWRAALAGVLMGVAGMAVPEVMGIGYDTVNEALLGRFGAGLLVALVAVKLLATSASVGLGVPGGMIGPALFMGAAAGSLVAILADAVAFEQGLDPGLYALLGMGAMMGASLQAPLSALTAMMELTHNPGIIMPGMLVVVVAALTASEGFGIRSVFAALLSGTGQDYGASPVMQALRRAAVASVMTRSFERHERHLGIEDARRLLSREPEWVLVEEGAAPIALVPAVDLAREAESAPHRVAPLDLLDIPAHRLQVADIDLRATLQEALERLDASGADALYVQRTTAPGIKHIYGVLTRTQLESSYRY